MNDEFKSQLTALAMHELADDEQAAIELALAEAPEARAYATETRDFCALLTQSLAAPAGAALTDEQRTLLVRQLSEPVAGRNLVPLMAPKRDTWLAWSMGLGAAAAAVVVTHFLWQGGDGEGVAVVQYDQAAAPMIAMRSASADHPTAPAAGVGDDLRLAEKADIEAGSGISQFARAERRDALDLGSLAAEGVAPTGDLQGLGTTGADGGVAPQADGSGVVNQNAAPLAKLELPPMAGEPLVAENLTERQRLSVDQLYSEVKENEPDTLSRHLRTESETAGGVPAANGPVVAEAVRENFGELKGLADQDGLLAQQSQIPAALAPESRTRGLDSDDVIDSKTTPPSKAAATLGLRKKLAPPDGEAMSSYYRFSKEKQVAEGFWNDESKLPSLSLSTRLSLAKVEAEAYDEVPENPFLAVASAPRSTFSIDMDTAGYANVRRFLNQGQRPPKAAVRLEEMVNYFRYDYPQPAGEVPFSVTVDLADCPWQPQHRLARIGLQGKSVAREARPSANLVFLIDVSGSMDEPNKLPLVRQSLHLLTSQLKGSDHVAMVTYAGTSGVALPSTSLENKEAVTRAIDALAAGGSTNGASGIQLAYQQARQNFKPGGVNRVLLATDGDFNVGLTSRDELQKLITDEAKSGVFLSVLGYGMGNLKDGTMEMLSDKGNGNYAYIDSLSEARKALGEQVEGTLHTIAKDVKIQVEFNPAQVRHYRLLGYENRLLAKEDFNDDTKDAGEIGAGHTVTALYEIVPMSAPPIQPPVDPLKYQVPPAVAAAAAIPPDQPVTRETMTVNLRYKAPAGATSQLIEVPVVDEDKKFAEAPADFKFAASVAMTGLLLKDSAHKGSGTWNMVRELARAGKGSDAEGYRGEFLQLVEKAAGVAP